MMYLCAGLKLSEDDFYSDDGAALEEFCQESWYRTGREGTER